MIIDLLANNGYIVLSESKISDFIRYYYKKVLLTKVNKTIFKANKDIKPEEAEERKIEMRLYHEKSHRNIEILREI